jgi:hypothetical protein
MHVDHRGAGAAVPHAVHQLLQGCPRARGEDVPGMAQVVKVRASQPSLRQRRHPGPLTKIAITKRGTERASKHKRIIVWRCEDGQVAEQVRHDDAPSGLASFLAKEVLMGFVDVVSGNAVLVAAARALPGVFAVVEAQLHV